MNTVLVVGATGVVGEAALAHFAASPGWTPIAVSRRRPAALGALRHLPLDLADPEACRAACAELGAVSHVVYAAVAEKPGLVAGWRDAAQMQLNLRMLQNLLGPLSEAAPGLAHVTLLQGAKAYGAHVGHLAPVPARETAPRDPHENFYWLQEDYIRELAARRGFAWTIFRPAIVVGAAWGAAMNPLLPLGAYAALRREEGQPFSYPGGVLQISEIVGADLLAEAFAWAGTAGAARHETFNITNGDVFAWRDAWPALAAAFGVEAGPDEPMRLSEYLSARAALWDGVVRREGLQSLALDAFLGESHHYADVLLRRDVETIGRPTLLSTIKLRQAGFAGCRDSVDSVRRWIGELQARKLLPKP
ncbi:SDR family oxidoreductase [Phenylobacterium sp. LjRoot219]|uniref:SDR family oxidoreductase n=1 Tax=Phenylobacterium sp. LjRoot219 TaxID=3342283 RepID=UPI003ECD7B01